MSVGERPRAKAGRWQGLAHTRWSGGRGYLRKLIGGERVVSGMGERVRVILLFADVSFILESTERLR